MSLAKQKLLILLLLVFTIIAESSCQNKDKDKQYRKYHYVATHKVKEIITNQDYSGKTPKNIILMIGDGMGTSQIYAGLVANKGNLNLSYFPVTGFQIPRSADDLITDSAASATAMATGNKTNNSMIAVDPIGKPYETILEKAEKRGLSTGLVSTSAITHATPAAFIAHNYSRNNYEAIASDFLKTDIDVFIGGGLEYFTERLDKKNLVNELKINGYTVVDSLENLADCESDKIAGLLYPEAAPSILEGRRDMFSISSSKALSVVKKNTNGFFMMLEASQIDWGNHQNDVYYQTEEMLDFDKVIGDILEFAIEDGETLVIVTADHETGGMAISGGSIKNGRVKAEYTTTGHSAVMVPVFAYGPQAELFRGMYENTAIFDKMMEAYGWGKKNKH